MEIDYELIDFKKGFNNGYDKLACSWTDIIHAAITVGRKDWKAVKRHGEYSIYEYKFRRNMINAFLRENRDGKLEITEAFKWLDPSEKTAVSFFLGLMGAKLFSRKLFDTPWLMHLDLYKNNVTGTNNNLHITYWKTTKNTRPDLIGLNKSGDWNVFEAKGRSNYSTETLKKAKIQSQSIKTINNQTPNLMLGTVTYYRKKELNIRIIDPDESNENAVELEIDVSSYLMDYYYPIAAFIASNFPEIKVYNTVRYVVTVNNCMSWKIGLDERIYNLVLNNGIGKTSLLNNLKYWGYFNIVDKRITQDLEIENLIGVTIGSDGIIVSL